MATDPVLRSFLTGVVCPSAHRQVCKQPVHGAGADRWQTRRSLHQQTPEVSELRSKHLHTRAVPLGFLGAAEQDERQHAGPGRSRHRDRAQVLIAVGQHIIGCLTSGLFHGANQLVHGARSV